MPVFRESISSLLDVGEWSSEKALRYLKFFRSSLLWFVVAAILLLFVLFLGAVLKQTWLISTAVLFIGLATAGLLILATPLAVPAFWAVETFDAIKGYFSVVVAFLLWALLFSLYLAIVPISNNPAATGVVLLLASAVAVLWARYGFGPNLHRTYASIIVVFGMTTVGFFFPKTFAAAGTLGPRLDERIARCLTNPSQCLDGGPTLVDPALIPTLEFFDASTGTPQYWYHLRPSGEYEVYDAPGFHPQTRDSLRIVTPEVVTAILQRSEAREEGSFAGPPVTVGATVPDLTRASAVHRATSLGDLRVARARATAQANGSFDVWTSPSSYRSYTPVFVQVDEVVSPHVFVTATVRGDEGISMTEIQGLGVHFIVDQRNRSYTIYNVPETCCDWKPLPTLESEGMNTLGLYQRNRMVWVYLDWEPVDSLSLWTTPTEGRVGLFFKANPRVQGHARFRGLAVYQF